MPCGGGAARPGWRVLALGPLSPQSHCWPLHRSATAQTHRRKSPGFLSSCVQAREAGPSAGGPKACVLRSLDEAPGRITVLRAPLWPTLSVKKWIRGLLIHTRTRQLDAKGARILSSVSQPASPAACLKGCIPFCSLSSAALPTGAPGPAQLPSTQHRAGRLNLEMLQVGCGEALGPFLSG